MSKRNARLSLGFVKSVYTGIIYVALFDDNVPIKLWKYDTLNEVGIDIINELIKGFDLGYDIEFQFPRDVGKERKIIPIEMVLIGEENGKKVNILNKRNAIEKESFYNPSEPEQTMLPEIKNNAPDPKFIAFLKKYEEEKGI